MILEVIEIDTNKSWTDWSGHARKDLSDRLKAVCPSLGVTERKRKAKELLSGRKAELNIEIEEGIESVCHLLEAIGARVILHTNKAEQ